MAGVSFGFKILATHFINVVNMRAMSMAMALQRGGVFVAAELHNLWANVAYYGSRAIAAVATWELVDPGGPKDVLAEIGGDPHPSQSASGMAVNAIKKLINKLWPELKEWYEQEYGE